MAHSATAPVQFCHLSTTSLLLPYIGLPAKKWPRASTKQPGIGSPTTILRRARRFPRWWASFVEQVAISWFLRHQAPVSVSKPPRQPPATHHPLRQLTLSRTQCDDTVQECPSLQISISLLIGSLIKTMPCNPSGLWENVYQANTWYKQRSIKKDWVEEDIAWVKNGDLCKRDDRLIGEPARGAGQHPEEHLGGELGPHLGLRLHLRHRLGWDFPAELFSASLSGWETEYVCWSLSPIVSWKSLRAHIDF